MFSTPSLPDNMRPHGPDPLHLWTSTRGRREIHTALSKRPVPRPTGPKPEIRQYDWNLFKLYYKLFLLLIYIAEKFPLFIPSKNEILVKRRQLLCMRRRQDDVSGL